MNTSAPPTRRLRLVLLGRLQDAEDDHDRARRERFVGVTPDLLDEDKARWTRIGGALAAVARQICDGCSASAFVEARPELSGLTARLSEAVDDQLDREAWLVVDAAAARLVAGER